MTYPDPRYLGEGGDVSAVFRPGTAEPELRSAAGNRTHFLATHDLTDGDFGLYRLDLGPRSPGASTHFHRTISESFFILDGEVQLFDGEQWITARRDDFLYVPAGGLHAFRNRSDEMASLLLLFTPGAPREDYFENVAEMARRGGIELEQFRLRHDSYFTDRHGERSSVTGDEPDGGVAGTGTS